MVEIGDDVGIDRRDVLSGSGRQLLRRQNEANRAEVLFADFGEVSAGSAVGHVFQAPVKHQRAAEGTQMIFPAR